jgi:hypothetical protein
LGAEALARPPLLLEGARASRGHAWIGFGWQRLSQTCLALQVLLFAASLVLYRATGIDVLWSSEASLLVLTALLGVAWGALVALRGDSHAGRRMAETLAAVILFLALIQITAPMQYGAIALGRPFVDGWLDRIDRLLGIDVELITAWTAQYPWLISSLNAAYETLGPQLFVPLFILPIAGDRQALWEYMWHLHTSLIGALVCLALWPTVYVFTYQGFAPLVSPAMVESCMAQLWALHSGQFHTLTLQDMQGLISFPSFHTAAAIAVTWSLRRRSPWIWAPIALLNVGLVSATVLLGLHYVTDLIGTVVLLAVSLAMHRRWFQALPSMAPLR